MIRNKRNTPVILTNDPSITAWGWVVVKNDVILAAGCIKTIPEHAKMRIRKSDDRTRRVSEIARQLHSIIQEYGVNYILSELPHGSQNAQAATMLGVVVGILQTMADVLSFPIEWFSEADSKKEALGKKAGSKNEMIERMCVLYNIPVKGVKYYDEAICDAMAVYNIAKIYSPVLKFYK